MSKNDTIETQARKESSHFVDEVQGLSVIELEKRLSDLAKGADEIEESKEADNDLKDAREVLKELSAPYRDAKKSIRIKTKYIISLIKEKGGK